MSSDESYSVDQEEDIDSEDDTKNSKHRFRSKAWAYFRIIDDDAKVASCKLCNTHFSFKSTSGNLRSHLIKKHGLNSSDITNGEMEEMDEQVESEVPEGVSEGMKSKAWRFFDVKDAVNKTAICRLCQAELCYRSTVTNLWKHVKKKHTPDISSYANNDSDNEKPRANCSPIWKFFRRLDRKLRIGMCLLCSQTLSYNASVGNLVKHMKRKHPAVNLQEDYVIKDKTGDEVHKMDLKMIKQDTSQDQDDPVEMEEIYLEDLDEHIVPKTKPKKRRYSTYSRNVEPEYEVIHEVRQPSKTEDSIDHFGTYVTSLLRQLPKSVASKLQAEFVKQIMDAQITIETATEHSANNDNFAIIIRREEPTSNNNTTTSNEDVENRDTT